MWYRNEEVFIATLTIWGSCLHWLKNMRKLHEVPIFKGVAILLDRLILLYVVGEQC